MPRTTWTAALVAVALHLPVFAQTSAIPTFTISTIAGTGSAGFSGDGGPAVDAMLSDPRGIAFDSAGNLYVADDSNNRIRKISPAGVITTVVGVGAYGFSGDGASATMAELYSPVRLSFSGGDMYIADSGNYRVRKVSDGIITTVAGNGGTSFSGDGGLAVNAMLEPADVVFDSSGSFYVPDSPNSRIRKITNGIITTVAGNGVAAFAGDGGLATNASLVYPVAIAFNQAGAMFISDRSDQRIRMISNGIISTAAGTGTAGFGGDGGPALKAMFNQPGGLSFDAAGNLYIADINNNRIRVLLTDGTIETVAGTGAGGFSGDGGSATNAALNGPRSVLVGPAGRIYIVDCANNRIRMLTPIQPAPSISPSGVVSASAFGGFTAVAPGSLVEVYGSNLASDSRSWTSSDFSGNAAPTSLDGTSATIDGQAAFINYISPTQIDIQVPSNVLSGPRPLVVTTAAGKSAAYTLTVNATEPGFLAPPSFVVGGKQYAVALFADGTYALPTGAISGVASRPAKPGDVLVFYGVGFGPVIPAISAGQIVQQTNNLLNNLQLSFGGLPATLNYQGLAPSYVGLYQFNVVVPNVPASDLVPITFTLAGTPGTQTLYIAVAN